MQLAEICWQTALDKQAVDPVILDLRGLTSIADYFVITSGGSARQITAIADTIREKTKNKGVSLFHIALDNDCDWLVLDFIEVIVHIFSAEARQRYRLEQLWGDAVRIK